MTTVSKLQNFIEAKQVIESLLAMPTAGLTRQQLDDRLKACEFLGKLNANIFFIELYEKDCV